MNDKSIPRLRFSEFTDEWERCKVKDIAPLQRGFDLPTTQMEEGIYPVVMSNGIGGKHTQYKVKGPGIVTGRSGTIGKLQYIEVDYWPHNTTLWVTDFYGNNQKFVYYMYQHLDLSRFSTGSGVPTLNRNDVHDELVWIPSISEQEKISEYLTNLDNLITLHQRKCNSLKELRDGIIQRILSRELRFKRTDGSEFENWVTKELSEIFTERKVSQTITEDAPLLSFTIEQGVINPQDKKTNKRDFLIKDKDTKKFALTEVDDIIYNPANLKYGAIHRNKLMRGVVSPIYAIFYTEQNPAFMEYVVKNPTFIKNSLKYLEGTVIKLMTLKPKDFLKLKVEIPASLEEQKIIADFLMQFDGTIDAEQRRIEKWKELKKGLIQQMFI